MERVDFYILDTSDERERQRFACRVIGKAFDAEQRVLVCLDDAAAVTAFDDLLWTFAQDSFIPHEPVGAESSWEDSPVLLSQGAAPPSPADVLLNLGGVLPAQAAATPRVIEIVDADPARRAAGRQRFKAYRDQGVEPTTHNISASAAGG